MCSCGGVPTDTGCQLRAKASPYFIVECFPRLPGIHSCSDRGTFPRVHEALVNTHWSSPSSVAQEDMWGGVTLVLLRRGDAASLGGVDQSTAVVQSTNSISRKEEALGWNTKCQVFVFEIHLPSWASSLL